MRHVRRVPEGGASVSAPAPSFSSSPSSTLTLERWGKLDLPLLMCVEHDQVLVCAAETDGDA